MVRAEGADVPPATSGSLESPGGRIAYELAGRPAGPPVLYVVGYASSLSLDHTLSIVAGYFERVRSFARLLRFDRRGQGLSATAEPASCLEDLVEDMERVREAAGLEQVAVFGESLSGMAAVAYAARYRERVTHLVLAGSPACNALDPSRDRPRLLGRRIMTMAREEPEGCVRLLASLIAPDREPAYQQAIASYLMTIAPPGSIERFLRPFATADVRPLLDCVAAPTLVVHAVGDQAVPVAHARALAARIPNARLAEHEGSGHLLWIDGHEGPLAVVEEFLARTPTGDGARPGALNRASRPRPSPPPG